MISDFLFLPDLEIDPLYIILCALTTGPALGIAAGAIILAILQRDVWRQF